MSRANPPRPVQLHIAHDLGGGAAKWLADYIAADAARENLVLRSTAHEHAAANGVALFRGADESPLKVWTFGEPIAAAVTRHPEYRAALHEAIAEHGVGAVLVSSLIGHSLEALETGLPTLCVTHDYFPYCPSINLYFGGPCTSCGGERLGECASGNPRFNPFANFAAPQRLEVREGFMKAIARPQVTLVAPSASVRRNLLRLDPRFADVRFAEIGHGYGAPIEPLPPPRDAGRLRVLVLGRMSITKGVELLREALPSITAFADVTFLGSGEVGTTLAGLPHVTVHKEYAPGGLRELAAAADPHVAVLASIVAETFSYALTELRMLGVPAVATRLGSFEDRIRHGVDGWLYEPRAQELVRLLRTLDADRASLAAVRRTILDERPKSAARMVQEYHDVLPMDVPRVGPAPSAPRPPLEEIAARQAMTLADMWKDVKNLHLRLSVAREAAEADIAKLKSVIEVLEGRVEVERKRSDAVIAALQHREVELGRSRHEADAQRAQIQQIYSSVSWRALGVFRRLRRLGRKLRLLARCLAEASHDPRGFRRTALYLSHAARTGGLLGLKIALLAYASRERPARAWIEYRKMMKAEILPALRRRLARMPSRPRISVLMATYNTAPAMLRSALDSVLAQIYPEWELCISDDLSTQPGVAAILREYAQRDSRIRVRWGTENRGVAHASNRALEMATGDYAVLMDHDDAIEEQALLRFAESIVADGPDILYSDEVITAPDGETASELVYRPAFSPELLRSHPYIVHLAGFRTSLLREIGGFDESLRISQDYDLMLRATERARKVAHIPEPLYRWRKHPASAGHQMMDRVMITSASILQRHLDRVGLAGTARPGFGFNFFDISYDLRPGLRVAAIIPTKNRGELVRQCVASLRRTVRNVPLDIVVVDHESDDQSTLAYLDTAPEIDRVLRYAGPFNFSAINNFAVRSLDAAAYTHYLFCNNDIEALEEGWLERMLGLAQQESVGAVGAKLLYGDLFTIQHSGVGIGLNVRAEHYGKFMRMPREGVDPAYYGTFYVNREVSAVTAALMLVRRDAFEEVAGFDETIAVGFGDVDLCLRMVEAGYRIVQCGAATLVHHESMTRGINDPHPADSALFEWKWRRLLRSGDPYYNPGLSTASTSWQPKSPLRCSVEICRRIVTSGEPGARQALRTSGDCD